MSTPKKIAIIGGGASGIITAYLLHQTHHITLYEKKAVLGGNVQTLNKNVTNTPLSKNVHIENGVLGFSQRYYPNFHKLLDHLKVPYRSYKPSISLFADQLYYPARATSYFNGSSLKDLLTKKTYRSSLKQLIKSQKNFIDQIEQSTKNGQTFDAFTFPQELYKNYMKSLFMLSFSTPFELVSNLPQTILNDYFLSLPNSTWSFIEGGVYSYMDTILRTTKMNVVCGVPSIKVIRQEDGVMLEIDGVQQAYDAVIIATTPGSVKDILLDMDTSEKAIFQDWDDQTFTTIAHKDIDFYSRFKKVRKTPMDLFYGFENDTIGYNTYQNTVYNLKTKEPLSFAYNLESIIAKESILHKADHTVPKYLTSHDAKINQINAINGKNNTYFAGAYLDNGLHEGAVVSAMNLSNKLQGIKL